MKSDTLIAVEPLRVTVPEAAKILGVSRSRLYEHIKGGTIRAVKDGGRTLFTLVELRAFVARSDPGGLN